MDLFRRKSVSTLLKQREEGVGGIPLRRDLSAFDLTFLGIGAIIGTGIFVLTGKGALTAGPGLVLSFIIAGIACALSAFAYAEFASMVPISGSVYTYTYVTLGEFLAWVIGWDLMLEYMLAVSTVSGGWSGYFQSFLSGFGIELPKALTGAFDTAQGTYFNLPAFLIVMIITFLLSIGVRESKWVNNIMVWLKLAVVVLVVLVGVAYVKPDNWTPFMPFGFSGVWAAASVVFFAYLGFDAVSSAAEETRNPGKDLPRGILWSLGICTIFYIIVTLIVTGAMPFTNFKGQAAPVSYVMKFVGQDWVAGIIDLGVVIGMMTVMLVMLYGQIRIGFAMSRDGLLPKFFSTVHPKYQTPYKATWIYGIACGLLGAIFPLDKLAELVNLGTLAAFVLISIAVIVLRFTQPNLERKFRCPGIPSKPGLAIFSIPTLAVIFCLFLMFGLPLETWIRFLVWWVIGIVIYFLYSRRKSHLNQSSE
ncbi:amino acid permease [Thermoflavimicrobium dichotomicum]|uniref:Basic amino acid/polyamine antiporter, APA family n=1 Tax=Thermoflavimicrobium dichotomicum TaxID=46223 RepID=A0A1I3LSZ4_9BACL|nr:amino acid permease [Thermoflavimicrobium dichotomicum]SFI87894.1 basic amino acid/polyamine antiporter, APA family [Thermoflavimicrobium dichotomicum]